MAKKQKGYLISTGYKGYLEERNKYQEFPTEGEYDEMLEEEKEERNVVFI